jgi:tetratricopeptide (TPR) repeat protein
VKKKPQPLRRTWFETWQNQLICLAIAIATFFIYSQTSEFDFVNFDDPLYSLNPHNREGPTAESLEWALTSADDSNWLPLTRLTHIVDTSLYGKRAGPVHVENYLLHIFASIMVFWFLFRATGSRWPSAFTGILFAVHPLHVESVAWASERKDVLCAVFWFLTLHSWVAYTTTPTRGRYLRSVLFFVLGLMSKPMIVSLPVILALLDFWPLRRPFSRALVVEKIPFALLSVFSAVVTFLVQKAGGAVQTVEKISVPLRIENSLTTWIIYPLKTLWPSGLAVFYPLGSGFALGAVLCGLLLAAISVAAVRLRQRFPFILTGWFWYLVSTLPVIGLVQVGVQSRADRYMYIPMVGLAMIAAWGASDFLRARPWANRWVIASAVFALTAFSAVATRQTAYWRDSETLFRHAIQVTERNDTAWKTLGRALVAKPNRVADAVAAIREEVRIRPDSAEAHAELAGVLNEAGQREEAIREANTSLRLDPSFSTAHFYKGTILQRQGKIEEAIMEFRIAIRASPSAAGPHFGLGSALASAGRMKEALVEDDEATRLDPDAAPAHYNKAGALLALGDANSAVTEMRTALTLDPNNADVHLLLGATLLEMPGRLPESIEHLQDAVRIGPGMAMAHVNLARALAEAGRIGEAIVQMRTAVQLSPDPALATILSQLEAMAQKPN